MLSEIKLWTQTYKSNASWYTFLGKSTQIVTENYTQIEKNDNILLKHILKKKEKLEAISVGSAQH